MSPSVTILQNPFSYYYPPIYGPSLPFYWQTPFYSPQAQTPSRFICTKKEDESGEEKFICEVDPESVRQQGAMYVRPFTGSWFF